VVATSLYQHSTTSFLTLQKHLTITIRDSQSTPTRIWSHQTSCRWRAWVKTLGSITKISRSTSK